MTIVVTGAAGFIGRNAVAALNQRGVSELLLVDQLGEDDKWKNLRGLVYEDLIQPGDLARWLDGKGRSVDAIVHLGACSATTERNADFLLENNYRFTRDLCTWAIEHKARFVYASSAATYGDGAHGYRDDDGSTLKLQPLNMYGYSKHMFDLWALRAGLLDRIVGLKFFNVFGPYEEHKGSMRSVVSKAYEEIIATGELSLFKSYRDGIDDGQQRRDFVYVDDAVAVLMHFLDNREVSGLYNCGTGASRTWLDLAHAVFAAMERPAKVRFVEMPDLLRAKYQYFTEADTTRLRGAGFDSAFLDLEIAVERYVRTHLSDDHDALAGADR